MTRKTRERLRAAKRLRQKILTRRKAEANPDGKPVLSPPNIHYDLADKADGIGCGGVGAMHLMLHKLLSGEIDSRLKLLKCHQPYLESDQVRNIAGIFLAGGKCLEDLKALRTDPHYLKALGASRLPDATTAGDYLRRFTEPVIELLQTAANCARLKVWRKQPKSFFKEAVVDADGTLVGTGGDCKAGTGMSYKGTFGYHPLLLSLANTGEPLWIVNRAGGRPSYEGAPEAADKVIAFLAEAGFRRIILRGDTAFSQTEHLDRWNAKAVEFVFGYKAYESLEKTAESLAAETWVKLDRPAKYQVKTQPRKRPEDVRQKMVDENQYKDIRLVGEKVAEFEYRPLACSKDYRMVVLHKDLMVTEGKGDKRRTYPDSRKLFYITNRRDMTPQEVVFFANDRCNQENLIEQLKNGVGSLRAPSNTLNSNWAFMVIASLAWAAKAWFALLQPAAEHKPTLLWMEFRKFVTDLMLVPCQLVSQGRRLIYRLLNTNVWTGVLLRGVEAIRRLRPT